MTHTKDFFEYRVFCCIGLTFRVKLVLLTLSSLNIAKKNRYKILKIRFVLLLLLLVAHQLRLNLFNQDHAQYLGQEID